MKKTIILSAIILGLVSLANAQAPITVLQHAGTSQVFYGTTSFSDAYSASIDGDTLYLSPGGYTPPASIAKGLTIIGSGHFPDSTSVMKRTTILGDLVILNSSENIHFEGLYINGNIDSDYNTSNVNVLRCRFASASSPSADNYSYVECFVSENINFSQGNNLLVKHCVINGTISGAGSTNLTIDGNILLRSNGFNFDNVNSSIIENNIILLTSDYTLWYSSNNICYNNVFCTDKIYEICQGLSGTNTNCDNYSINNYFGVSQSDIFVNQTGNTLDYSHNYHLKNPETYIGTDGTQVGLYGSAAPFKDGGFPSNPQILKKQVDTQTDSDGNLPVNFTIKAQDY